MYGVEYFEMAKWLMTTTVLQSQRANSVGPHLLLHGLHHATPPTPHPQIDEGGFSLLQKTPVQ